MMNRTLNRRSVFRKPFILLLLSMLCPVPAPGQAAVSVTPEPASLDSARAVTVLNEAMNSLEKDSFDLALDQANEALQSAMLAGTEETETAVLSLIAEIYNRQGLAGEAIPYYLRAANIFEKRGDTSSLSEIYAGIAHNYHLESVYEKEGEYYNKVLRLTPLSDYAARTGYLEKIGLATLLDGKVDSSITYFNDLRTLLDERGRDDSQVLNYLVRAYSMSGRYEKALEYNGILFDRYSQQQDFKKMSVTKNNMGYDLTLLGDYENAALAYREAIDYGEKAGLAQKDLSLMMTNAGICYQNMEENKQAIPYFQMSINALDGSGEPGEKSRVENILALVYYHEEDLYNAGFFSKNSIESALQAGDPRRLSEGYLTYSRILSDGNDPVQALEYYEEYLNIRDSLQLADKLEEQELVQKKTRLEKSERDLILKLKEEQVNELAIQQLTLQLEREEQEKELIRLEDEKLRDSLTIKEQQHAAEQQERQNRMLAQEAQIMTLELEKDSARQKEQEQEIQLLEQKQEMDRLELDRQKTVKKALILTSALGLLVTVLILGSLIWTRKKNALLAKQKAEIEDKNRDLAQKNEEISSQRDEIEAQRDEIEAQRDMLADQKEEIENNNKEILKSHEYAKKIQTSTLPDLESLNSLISDHFLFFRPRDIVSGDFFWTATVENTTVLTVSDCTGHGVPGAFMSMLGMSLLKEIVQKEYITHPAVILRRLRKEVINALGQKGQPGEQRDGMDLALITLFHDSGKLAYAGAYNPLYIARRKEQPRPEIENISVFESLEDNGYILYEIQADKMPIGYFVKMDKFSSHELELREGDNIYLFSDGYPDQFGGPRGKKFKYKPFKEMLLRNAHLSMKQQNQILGETLDDWMGIQAQVDDICVIGLRI